MESVLSMTCGVLPGSGAEADDIELARCARMRIEGTGGMDEVPRPVNALSSLSSFRNWLGSKKAADDEASPAGGIHSWVLEWKGDVAFVEIPLGELLNAVEAADLTPQERRFAYEEMGSQIWFLNRIEIWNEAGGAIASKNLVAIRRKPGQGRVESIGGTIGLARRGEVLSGVADNILPKERRYEYVISSGGALLEDELLLASDPGLVVSLSLLYALSTIGSLVFALYLFANLSKGRRKKSQTLRGA